MTHSVSVNLDVQVNSFEELPAKLAALATVGAVRGFNFYEDTGPAAAPQAPEAPAPKVGKGKKQKEEAAAPAEAPAPAPAEPPATEPETPSNALPPKKLVELRQEAARVIGANAQNRVKVHALVATACAGQEQPALSKVPADAADKLLADIAALAPQEAAQ